MAGFPMRRALERKIEELGGIEFVTAHISQGMTIGRLAEFIECSRPMLSFWINHTDERRDAVLAASIFHYGEFTVGQAKERMRERGIAIRL